MENEVLLGDCKDTLKRYPAETFDCIVTDPPYGYSFMGKSWDKALPSVEALKECCRVLKSGAFAFFMCAPRQDVLSRMIIRLEEAGFQTGFTSVYWCYASGFPKAANVSKLIDNRFGEEREIIITGNPIARMIPGSDQDKTGSWAKDDGRTYTPNITLPKTDQAKQFDGSFAGFQPKPAVEIIIVCMKPLSEKTYVDQALTNGKGVTWLGECRIPYEDSKDPATNPLYRAQNGYKNKQYCDDSSVNYTLRSEEESERVVNTEGRFPANLLVSDDVLNDGMNHKSCKSPSQASCESIYRPNQGRYNKQGNLPMDSGSSFSRYFDLDAWFKSKLPEQAQLTYPYLIVPKPAKSEKNKYCENKHPTVKPLKLMSYLITMGSREGDVILDPFAGSGTTLEAARVLNRKFVGCELTEEYKDIIEARAGVSITSDPYRNVIEVTERNELTIEQMEESLTDSERDSYEGLLIEAPYEIFETVRKAYFMGKGLKV